MNIALAPGTFSSALESLIDPFLSINAPVNTTTKLLMKYQVPHVFSSCPSGKYVSVYGIWNNCHCFLSI